MNNLLDKAVKSKMGLDVEEIKELMERQGMNPA